MNFLMGLRFSLKIKVLTIRTQNDQNFIVTDSIFSHFPEETWEEVIMWIKRIQLGQHVSLVSNRFFRIAYPFMHEEKQHCLPELLVFGGNHKPWMIIRHVQKPIKELSKSDVPTVEVPENITAGNNHLTIRYVKDLGLI